MTRVAEKTGLERNHSTRKLKRLGVDLTRNKRARRQLEPAQGAGPRPTLVLQSRTPLTTTRKVSTGTQGQVAQLVTAD